MENPALSGEECGVEVEGDEDLLIASRDFNKIAASRNKVFILETGV